MRISVDLMGGDHAPKEIFQGAMSFAELYPQHQVILVGKKEIIETLVKLPGNISTYPAEEVMGMDEPVTNLVKKKDSSIWVATKLVKDNQADAVISAGSTAAQMTSALLQLGRIKGISRPAIATILPTLQKAGIMLDIGANADCKPEMLYQFAVMGSVYSQIYFGIKNPRIALLSNGEEECKGNELVVATHEILAKSGLNFIGNKEGRDLIKGGYDVMVCDGFTGNVALKTIEGTAGAIFSMLKKELTSSALRKLGAGLIKPGLKQIKNAMDYSEYGGAPLLGVKGISIICHGSSNNKAIFNAMRVAETCWEGRFVEKIEEVLQKENIS